MFARARIPLKTEGAVLLAPLRAVQELQGKNFVWVVGADKIAKQRMVKVGQEVGSDVIILENLKAGERIIVDGVQKAKDGEPVEPRTAAEMAKAATAQPKSPEGTSAKE
jgi:multidrug efflux pump subunit AcrA (membrane-fusion protein)